MKKWFKVAMCALMVCALSSAFTGCINNSGTSWLNQLTCEHEWEDGVVTKEATCTEEGTLTKTCEKCEKVKTEKTPKAEHDEELLMKTDSTCDVDGEALYECKDCGAFRKEVLKAEGHSAVKCTGVAATCGEEGYTDYVVCETCDKVLTPSEIIPVSNVHNYGEDGLCTVCQSPKAAEVLAMYASAAASDVLETTVTLGGNYAVYTVIRVYRDRNGNDNNAFHIKELVSSFKFCAWNIRNEELKNCPYYSVYNTSNLDLEIVGDFAYAIYGDYVDFCVGKKFSTGDSTYVMNGETHLFDSSFEGENFTIGETVMGDEYAIKVLSLKG